MSKPWGSTRRHPEDSPTVGQTVDATNAVVQGSAAALVNETIAAFKLAKSECEMDETLDLHTCTAAHLLGVDGSEVTKEQRAMAKHLTFGMR